MYMKSWRHLIACSLLSFPINDFISSARRFSELRRPKSSGCHVGPYLMNDEHWAQAHVQADWLPYKPITFMRSGTLITDSLIDRPIPWHRELLSELVDSPANRPPNSLGSAVLTRANWLLDRLTNSFVIGSSYQRALTPRSTNKLHAIGSSYRSSLIHPINRHNLCDWKLLSELIDKHYQPTNSLPSVKLLSELLESTDRPTNSLRLGALIRVHLPTRSGALIRAHWLPDRPANSLRSVPLIGAHWPPWSTNNSLRSGALI